MSFEDWNFNSISRQVRDEFGVGEDNPSEAIRVRQKVNQALSWVGSNMRSAPWYRKDLVVDIPTAPSSVVSFTKGSRLAVVAAGGAPPKLRDVVTLGSVIDDLHSGYMVTAVSGSSFTLQSNYRGETVADTQVSYGQGFIEMPVDFAHNSHLTELSTLEGDIWRFVGSREFEIIKRTRRTVETLDRIYTVRVDPLGQNALYYLVVFPYIGDVATLHGEYHRDAPKLVNGNDIPLLPRAYRVGLFYLTCWFYAQATGHEKFPFYRDQALHEIDLMKTEHELSEDMDYLDNVAPNYWDTSGLSAANFPPGDDFLSSRDL